MKIVNSDRPSRLHNISELYHRVRARVLFILSFASLLEGGWKAVVAGRVSASSGIFPAADAGHPGLEGEKQSEGKRVPTGVGLGRWQT